MNHWVIPAVATLGGLGGVMSLIGFVFHNNNKNDKRVSNVYRRLDEVKAFNDNTFVRTEMCAVLNKQMRDDITEIKQDIKTLLKHSNGQK